jgi:two-component system CheB/CheR fusion protein
MAARRQGGVVPLPEQSRASGVSVVAIGSSAGGLEALKALLPFLPSRAQFAYVIAQHLSPQQGSILGELLTRDTILPVEDVRDGTPIGPDRVFVCPPGHDVIVREGRLLLHEADERGARPSIDRLFESVAEEYGEYGVAVLLSGRGADGARGACAVKAAGGIVFAQDPVTAKHPEMPRAAISAGCVDDCLAPKEIGLRLQSQAGVPVTTAELIHPHSRELDQLLEILLERTGIEFREYRSKTLSRRIAQRMAAVRVSTVADYLEVLRSNGEEAAILGRSCLIAVTSFFRDMEAFEALGGSLSRLEPSELPLRIWVPGCATGEEAFSLSMLLEERLPGRRFQIFGTDIDENAIATARSATYSEEQVSYIPGKFRDSCLSPSRPAYQIDRRLRDRIVFSKHDVARDPQFLNLDLISCRNLLIYLKPSAQQRLIRKFHNALKPGGLLFLGKSEQCPPDMFDVVNARCRIFANRHSAKGSSRGFLNRDRSLAESGLPPASVRPSPNSELLRGILVDRFAPPAVLVDTELRVIESCGPVDRYLTVKAGRPETTITSLVPKGLAGSLRAQISRCRRTMHSSRGAFRNIESGGRSLMLQTLVDPIHDERTGATFFLVTFVEGAGPKEEAIAGDEAREASAGGLARELNATRDSLQAVVEQMESSNEELRSVNEERQAAIEELRASNEELQSMNEELQSTNEELMAVNEELANRSLELAVAAEDVESVQNHLDCPLVVLNSAGRVRTINQTAFRYLGLNANALGGQLVIPGAAALSSGLGSRIERVLEGETVPALRARIGNRHFATRVLPQLARDGSIRGALVLFVDISDLVRATERLRVTIDSLPSHVAILDPNGKIVVVNAAWRKFAAENGLQDHRYSVGRNYVAVCQEFAGQGEESPVATGIRKVLSGELDFFTFDYPCHSPSIQRWFKLLVTPIFDPRGRGVFVMHTDISDYVALLEQTRRQSTALQTVANAIFITDAEGRIDWANESFSRLSGRTLEEVIGRTPSILETPGTPTPFSVLLTECITTGQPRRHEVPQVAKGGAEYTVAQTITPIPSTDGDLSHFVVVQEDITSRKNAEAKIVYLAEHDALTGLWNRKTFVDRLSEALDRQGVIGGRVAVLFLDLDRFKDTNDTMGHLAGDKILAEVARRLRQNLREKDALARLGGDEFVIFLEKVADRDSVSFVSVNFSAVQFHQQDVFSIITESMKSYGLAAGSLKAEITESVLLNRSNRVRESLHALHGAGIGLVLDDFGTGYSSLTYLQQFPIEAVKIDASFLRGIGKNRNDEAIVTGIIKLAHSLGQSVVAEGVETEEQMRFLRDNECDFAQGFLMAPPLPAREFEAFLESGVGIVRSGAVVVKS